MASKRVPIRSPRREVGRNSRCLCGSGLKFKKCCGAKSVAPPLLYKDLRSFYTDAQKAAEPAFIRRWGFKPDPTQLRVFMLGTEDDQIAMVAEIMKLNDAQPAAIAGMRAAKRLVTTLNRDLLRDDEKADYYRAMVQAGAFSPPAEEPVAS